MLDLMRSLIGVPPLGCEPLEYVFAFALVMVGLAIVGAVMLIPFQFIRGRR